jgi:hypothetical protein
MASDISVAAVGGSPRRRQSGFVLPFALVVIASLALIAAAAYAAVSKSAETMRAISEGAAEDIALTTAEAQATFAFLTAVPVAEGIWLGAPEIAVADDAASAADPSDRRDSPSRWGGTGQARAVDAQGRRVIVEYRDAAGLFPISSASEATMARFLETFGFSRDAAAEMAARIGDYEDLDNVRRFRGAERTDYRLFSRDPPTNSPLRAPEEVGRVLGFFEAAPAAFWSEVAVFATAEPGTIQKYAAPARLAPLIAASGAGDGDLDAIAAQSTLPSARARFLLRVSGERRTRTRAIEIRRSSLISQAPFRRYMVYETTEPAQSNTVGDVDPAPLLFVDPDGAAP